jgi:N-acetylglucosaminyl-diphospho-decaprenol L-rhamnosyltransferase
MRMRSSVDVVVVEWNSGGQLRDCIESIPSASGDDLYVQVTIVANSPLDWPAAAPGTSPKILRNDVNRGFAAACNQGASASMSEFLLFLNPDVRLCSRSIEIAVAFLQRRENSAIGIVGIQLVGEDGVVARSCARFPTFWNLVAGILGLDRVMPTLFHGLLLKEWDHRVSREVDQVIVAFFLVRRKVFQELGGFDERFFMYFDDLDFSFRARRMGWRSYYFTGAKAYHRGGGSSSQVPARRMFYSLNSRILYVSKHFGRSRALLVTLGTLVVEPVIRLFYAAGRLSVGEARATLTATTMLWRRLPEHVRALAAGPALS